MNGTPDERRAAPRPRRRRAMIVSGLRPAPRTSELARFTSAVQLVDLLARSPSIDAILFTFHTRARRGGISLPPSSGGRRIARLSGWAPGTVRTGRRTSRYLIYFTADKYARRVPRWGQINMVHLGLTTPFQFQVALGDWKYNASATVPCPPVTRQSVRCPHQPACFTEGRFCHGLHRVEPGGELCRPRELLDAQHENRNECEDHFAGRTTRSGRFSPFYAQQVASRRTTTSIGQSTASWSARPTICGTNRASAWRAPMARSSRATARHARPAHSAACRSSSCPPSCSRRGHPAVRRVFAADKGATTPSPTLHARSPPSAAREHARLRQGACAGLTPSTGTTRRARGKERPPSTSGAAARRRSWRCGRRGRAARGVWASVLRLLLGCFRGGDRLRSTQRALPDRRLQHARQHGTHAATTAAAPAAARAATPRRFPESSTTAGWPGILKGPLPVRKGPVATTGAAAPPGAAPSASTSNPSRQTSG